MSDTVILTFSIYIIDFSSNYNANGSILKYNKLQALRGLRIFRRTTKFKRFTFGISKSARTRRTYIKKKRKSSNIMFQKLTYHWCQSYLKKRSLENFFYFMFAFAYLIPVPHTRFIYKKALHKSFIDSLTLNTGSVSQKTVYNNSIFRKSRSYFKETLRYHECSYITCSSLHPGSSGFSKLLPWGILFDNNIYSLKAFIKNGSSASENQHVALFAALLTTILRLVLHVTLALRRISVILTMRP